MQPEVDIIGFVMSYHKLNEPKLPPVIEWLVDFFGSFVAFAVFIGAPLLSLGMSHKAVFVSSVTVGVAFSLYMLAQLASLKQPK